MSLRASLIQVCLVLELAALFNIGFEMLNVLLTLHVLISIPASGFGQQCVSGNVRLIGGEGSHEGRVEVCKNESWGTVCDYRWSSIDAKVLCRQLGYNYDGAIARSNAYFGRGTGLIHLSNVGCTGIESTILNCSYSSSPAWYCTHYDDAGVTCFRTVQYNITGGNITAIRLTGNQGINMGRLEVLYNGIWGTICSYTWSLPDAVVTCRMIGYDDAACALSSTTVFGRSSLQPVLDNVWCTGTETALDMCSFTVTGLSNSGCSYSYYYYYGYYDAGVVCINTSQIGRPHDIQLVSSTTKTLKISWKDGELPDDVWDRQYNITYHSESVPRSVTTYGNRNGGDISYTLQPLIRDTEYTIQIRIEVRYSQCSIYTYGNYSDPVTFRTNSTAKRSKIPIRLVSTYSGVDFLGRVEVFYANQWGTICDDYFSETEGNVVCLMLNFTQGALCTVDSSRYGQGTGPIWLDDVHCTSADEVLEDCYFPGWGINNCGHSEDVGVICSSTLPSVKNLTVVAVSARSVTLKWNRYIYSIPNFNDTSIVSARFHLLYKTKGTSQSTIIHSTSQTKYTLRNLQIQQQYQISIRAETQYYCSSTFTSTRQYGDYSNIVNVMTGKPVYFQLRMTPVYNCLSFMAPSMDEMADKLTLFRRAIVDRFNTEVCKTCNLTAADINDDEFSCRGGLTKHIVYRGEISNTEMYSAPTLVSLLQSWVASGSASITVLSYRLHLDKHCTTLLKDLSEPDCPLHADVGDSAGEISGLIVGVTVFTVLTVVLMVVIVIVVLRYRKWKKRVKGSTGHITCHDYDDPQNAQNISSGQAMLHLQGNQAYQKSISRLRPPQPIYDTIQPFTGKGTFELEIVEKGQEEQD